MEEFTESNFRTYYAMKFRAQNEKILALIQSDAKLYSKVKKLFEIVGEDETEWEFDSLLISVFLLVIMFS